MTTMKNRNMAEGEVKISKIMRNKVRKKKNKEKYKREQNYK